MMTTGLTAAAAVSAATNKPLEVTALDRSVRFTSLTKTVGHLPSWLVRSEMGR
jgi:hypothetical protein